MLPRCKPMVAKDTERRRISRTHAVFAVKIDSDTRRGRLGVVRDASEKGLLVVTPSSFRPGERLELTVFAGEEEFALSGTVARLDENPFSSSEPWRWRVAISLDQALPEIVVREGARNHGRGLRAA